MHTTKFALVALLGLLVHLTFADVKNVNIQINLGKPLSCITSIFFLFYLIFLVDHLLIAKLDQGIIGTVDERYGSVTFDWWPRNSSQEGWGSSGILNIDLSNPRLNYLASQVLSRPSSFNQSSPLPIFVSAALLATQLFTKFQTLTTLLVSLEQIASI